MGPRLPKTAPPCLAEESTMLTAPGEIATS